MKNLVSSKALVVTLIALTVVVCTTWAVNRSPTMTRLGAASGGSLDERIDLLLQAQEAQARRLDRLEVLLTGRSGHLAGGSQRTGAPAHAEHDEEQDLPVSAAQGEQKMRALVAQAEAKFVSEPLSAAWAAPTEKMIDSAFTPKNLEWNQAPTPLAHDAKCHSTSCRVEVTYQDDLQADIGQQFMLGDIAARLPRAKLFRLRNPDGTVQVIAYANTGSGRARR